MKTFKTIIKGVLIGTADLVPGVSGGTIALILGIYNKLITSLSRISFKSLGKLKNDGINSFWSHINGNFLFLILAGAFIGIFSFTYLVDWLIKNHSIFLWAFFSGLVLSSSHMIFKRIKNPNYNLILFFIFGITISFLIGQTTENNDYSDLSYIYLFFSGFIAIIAMILPGISGAYILILLGTYSEIISTIKNLIIILIEREFTSIKLIISELMVFGSGIICGLLIFSKLVKWLLSNYFDKTLSFMLGLMIGGMNRIWPWQQNGEAVSPNAYIGNSNILLVVFFFVLGGLFLIGLNFLEKNLTNEKKKNFK
ncbi:MAG: DUF368 domain-containing protein [Flavobacteriaceae bacterium]|nr:DUF368 domain-containing protein [Flavobacteriaceae bacterium]